jgi:hypothetical protein
MPRATTAWYVRRLCSRVSDYMAHGAMTPAEPHVQQARCDPTQGDESATMVDRHPHGTCGVRHGGLCPPAGLALCQSDGDRPQRAGLQSAWRTSLRHGPAPGLREAGLVCGFRVSLCSLKVVFQPRHPILGHRVLQCADFLAFRLTFASVYPAGFCGFLPWLLSELLSNAGGVSLRLWR